MLDPLAYFWETFVKRLLTCALLTLAVAALGLIGSSALAADMPVKAPPSVAAPAPTGQVFTSARRSVAQASTLHAARPIRLG
jgi:hypothetical protein